MFFMKIFEGYGFLVRMIVYTIMKAKEFFMFFGLFLLFFTVNYKILDTDFGETDTNPGGMPEIPNLIIISLRIAVGDIQVPVNKMEDY